MCWRKLAILTSAILLSACGGGGSTDLSGGGSDGGTTPSTEPSPGPSTEPTVSPSDAPSNKVTLTIPGEVLELDRKNNTIPFPYTLDLIPSFDAKYSMEITGTAVMGEDYDIDPKQELIFSAGSKTATLNLTTYQSSQPRGGRTLKIRFSNDEGQEATQTFIISGDVRLNDTGMASYSDETDYNLPTEPASHPGQDASRGFDVVNVDDAKADAPYYKDGSERSAGNPYYLGQAGFRYSKMNFAGKELNANATDWRCVKDEITGMVWERRAAVNNLSVVPDPNDPTKQTVISATPDNFHASNFKYAWLNSDANQNGGFPGWKMGDINGGALKNEEGYQPASLSCAYERRPRDFELYCSTEQYIEEANFQGVCGFKDWTLPTVEQLRSIFNYGNAGVNAHVLDPTFFDCASNDCVTTSGDATYWTSTTSAEQPASALCFDISSGALQICSKQEAHKMLLVRRDDKSLVNNNPTPSAEPTPAP
ncbi:DUF1566 domain-containing protein [Motilimonas sp. 1_MG-2023]|uniref:Lcl C-terminal domain-containing protein n=1 Tax=Motilimonas sp. 1_MG-2023 TaxID=3062672 RepID=UPI0026E2382E|nr:DUF1566 domain-containing protein [Motilimonas sp. 1_MG-2023]